jgi:phosphoheptose isomerase
MNRKIAFISEHASPLAALGGIDSGGQNVYVGELAKNVAKLGYEVDIFTRWDDERLPQTIEWSNGVHVVHIQAGPVSYVKKEGLLPYMDEFTRNMIRYMRMQQQSYKLIHANFFMSALVAADIKKQMGIPFVVTFHALGKVRLQHQKSADKFPMERLQIEEQIMEEADKIIAECPQDKDDLINLYNANPRKISTIPCGFNPYEFYPIDKLLARTILNLKPDEKIILQLGRMVPRKGVDNVIKGLDILVHQQKTKAHLVIVGGESDSPNPVLTPEIGRLQRLAKQYKVTKYITFLGRKSREQLKYYYSAADIFVTTPWYEPFGITPLEAMACGTPIVGSNVGGIKYSVINGKTGYLVPPNDPPKLAERLHDILQNQKIHQYFRENAVKRANTSFTWMKIANAVANLYEDVLSRYSSLREDNLTTIERGFDSAVETYRISREVLRIPVLDAALTIARSLKHGGKVLICGNGGSASQSQHFAAELVGRFMDGNREGLPALSLTADTAIITAWANDIGFEQVFARQVEAYGKPNDVLIGISTSGLSNNIIEAFKYARHHNILCIGLLGKDGGELAELSDISVVVPSHDTQRIQEVHINIIHLLCEIVEKQLFSQKNGMSDKDLMDLVRMKLNRHYIRIVKAS